MSTLPSTLTTARLQAEPISLDDLSHYVALHQDPQVMATLGGRLFDPAQTEAGLRRMLAHWQAHGFGIWTFRLADSERFVGRCGLRLVLVEGIATVELLYAVAAEHWRQGFATEMAGATIAHGFLHLGCRAIAAWTLPTNRGSRGVMEACKMRHLREIQWAGMPHVFYELDVGEWRNATGISRD